MNEESTTQTLGSTTVVFGWVQEAQVQQVLHAADGFQGLQAITLAGGGGLVAALVALIAGTQHPVGMYLLITVLACITVIPGLMAIRENRRYREARSQLMAVTARVPVPVLLVTPGSPTFTVGGQTQASSAPSGQGGAPVQQAVSFGTQAVPPGGQQAKVDQSATEGVPATEGSAVRDRPADPEPIRDTNTQEEDGPGEADPGGRAGVP